LLRIAYRNRLFQEALGTNRLTAVSETYGMKEGRANLPCLLSIRDY
jgi:hypothetical protein